jgi:hypothetical protein
MLGTGRQAVGGALPLSQAAGPLGGMGPTPTTLHQPGGGPGGGGRQVRTQAQQHMAAMPDLDAQIAGLAWQQGYAQRGLGGMAVPMAGPGGVLGMGGLSPVGVGIGGMGGLNQAHQLNSLAGSAATYSRGGMPRFDESFLTDQRH